MSQINQFLRTGGLVVQTLTGDAGAAVGPDIFGNIDVLGEQI